MFKLSLVLGALVLASCGGAKTEETSTPTSSASGSQASIVGRYTCVHPDSTRDTAELKAGGTVTITRDGDTTELTWFLEGDRGGFNLPDRPEPDRFRVENDRLIFDDGSTCTRTT